jgi:hypothetical protein
VASGLAGRTRYRRSTGNVCAVLLFVSLQVGGTDAGAVVSQRAAAVREVYAVLLAQRYHGAPASLMVLKDRALAMPGLRKSAPEWLKEFDRVPVELRRGASDPSPAGLHPYEASLFPPGTRLVPSSAVEAVFREPRVEENWAQFRQLFRATGWLAFSGVLVTRDALNAVVYFESRCGGVCGEGGYFWLRRRTAESPWTVAKRIVSWMS